MQKNMKRRSNYRIFSAEKSQSYCLSLTHFPSMKGENAFFMKKKTVKKDKELKSKTKEAFCKAYAGTFWGDPVGAAENANWTPSAGKAVELLSDPEIVERIRELRKKKAALSVADEAWIAEAFISIVQNAEKDADKLRALAGLQKFLAMKKTDEKQETNSSSPHEAMLPLFEGCEDGEGDFF